jgi:hypothetical protein
MAKAHLRPNGMPMKQGTIYGATLIAASTSNKNENKEKSYDAPDL